MKKHSRGKNCKVVELVKITNDKLLAVNFITLLCPKIRALTSFIICFIRKLIFKQLLRRRERDNKSETVIVVK